MYKNIPVIALFLLTSVGLSAQDVLSLDQATEITLANNYGILVAKNNVLVAENNTERRANGYLPRVSANAGLNSSLGGSHQSFSTGLEASTSNAFTWGGNASVGANYTLYDKRRSLTMDQLRESLNLSNLQLRQTIEANLLQVYAAYYQLAQLAENTAALEEALSISRERLRRAEYQQEYGQGSGLNVLNAQVDIQRDSVNLLTTRQLYANAQRNLNVLMGRTTTTAFQVDTTLQYEQGLDLGTLLSEAKDKNVTAQLSRQSRSVNELNLQLIDAENVPTVTAGASYGFNYSDNPDQAFITSSDSRSLAANVGLSWTIFDGTKKVRRQNALLNLGNLSLQLEQVEQELERNLINAWENYQNALFILNVERAATATNRENFDRTQAQLSVGQLGSLEFRQAQLNLLNAQVNLNNAKYTAKLRELELLQLAGRLME
ncbi:MAG: TolC family protein [Saprospiraceae bacterium]